jgi:hypothetical protein
VSLIAIYLTLVPSLLPFAAAAVVLMVGDSCSGLTNPTPTFTKLFSEASIRQSDRSQ